MAMSFQIADINFVAYITAETKRPSPRCEEGALWQFLYSFSDIYEVQRHTISTDPDWQFRLQQQASFLASKLDSDSNRIFGSGEAAEFLDPLREFFTGYDLYVLLIPDESGQAPDIIDMYENFVYQSRVNILVLRPYRVGSFVNVVDPFPAIQALASMPISPPAAVFWTKLGSAVAMSSADAAEFFRKAVATKNATEKSVNKNIEREARSRAARTILHISDLHFGDVTANARKNYLKQHLSRVVPLVDRVVISGDLFDQPKAEMREIFDEFRTDIESWSPKTPIIVPGNHDVRKSGNQFKGIGENTDHFMDTGFQPLVIDHDLQVVFFCFNSCEGGDFATGLISPQQRTSRGTAFEKLIKETPEAVDYSRVAVVHHHPYKYDSKPTVFYEKVLRMLSSKEDRFISFENADEFLQWCAARDVSLILHGHKHIPHVVMANITVRQKPRNIMIVGCGSSTGVENKPMCYDLVSLDPITKRWTVSFYSDPTGDGSGFDLQNVTLDFRTELPRRE
jgi:predicted MPP superfamily phosphohydrolase